ncbi:MAG: hypothetical protein LBT22_08695 [Peptococcaceae bacterium]|nr:hypothetical protein [Peptococcaceae bacterium]
MFPIKESLAYPDCPYCCGGRGLVLCTCGHLNCAIVRNGPFTCEWCGMQGKIDRRIQRRSYNCWDGCVKPSMA